MQSVQNITVETIKNDFFQGKKYDSFFDIFMVVRSLRFEQNLDQRLHHIIDQNDLIQVLTGDLI